MKSRRNLSKFSDEELLSRFRETKDSAWFGALYDRFIPLVYGLCLKYLADRDAAQDAVMDIFELTLHKLPQYEVANFKTWLYSVAKNHCLGVLRKENKNLFVKIDEAVMENQDIFTLIEKPQTKEEMEALQYCLGTLPEEQKRSIIYFFLEDKSYVDIVDETGYALSKVKSYIQNGKRNLKSCLIRTLHLSE